MFDKGSIEKGEVELEVSVVEIDVGFDIVFFVFYSV